MTKKLKGAIIGLGGIARMEHMVAYENNENVAIVAICDILPEKIENFKKEFSMDVSAFIDYKEVLNTKGLDFVDICTPNYLHSVIAVEALNKGINVFCEKPDAVSASEALKMKEAAEKSGKVLMVMRNNRYRKTSAFLKKFINDGKKRYFTLLQVRHFVL